MKQKRNVYNNPYKFNAKELDEDTGLYYYGARYYNPRLSIWYGMDPLAEKYPEWTPNGYMLHNPIKYIDPYGRAPMPTDVITKVLFANIKKYASGTQCFLERDL